MPCIRFCLHCPSISPKRIKHIKAALAVGKYHKVPLMVMGAIAASAVTAFDATTTPPSAWTVVWVVVVGQQGRIHGPKSLLPILLKAEKRKRHQPTDGPTDGSTDGPTDGHTLL